MNRIIHSIVALLLWAFIPLHLSGAIRYVKPGDASTAWQGKENVYSDLQEALAAAVEGDEIWVAAGTYKPTTGTDRTISFELKNGVKLYGGFTGSEASREERNWYTNQTILSGDIGTEGLDSDNSCNVVVCQLAEEETTWLDGFIVEKGYADIWDNNLDKGGGLYQSGGELTIVYCWFRNNFAKTYGGANFQKSGVTKCYASVFSNNKSREVGIAIFNSNDYTLVNSVVSNNTSDYDASAIYANGNFFVENAIVVNNSGGIDNNGSKNYSCFSEQINGTGNIDKDPIFLNAEQNDFRLINSSPCIGAGSSSNLPDWLTKDFQGNKLVSDDGTVSMGAFAQPVYVPQVVAPVNKQIYERGTQNVSLEWQWDSTWPDVSTAFDLELKESGQSEVTIIENASSPYQITVAAGQNWQWRVRNVNNNLKGEWSQFHQFFVPSDQPLFVKVGGAGSGTSWNNAYGDLQLALQQSVPGDEIWVAAGTYKPTTSDDVNISFELKDGVKLYGGFIGTETNLEERDWNRNKTILSGDIGIVQDYKDNSSHVISAIGAKHFPIGEGTELNGFVVTNGYAAHWEKKVGSGGGLYCKNAAPCFRNVLFLENRATNDGGAVYVSEGSAPEFFNCLFVKNLSYMGAGAYVLSSASFYNCLWYKNETRHLEGRYETSIEGQAVDIYNDSDIPLTIGNSVIALTDNNSGAFNAMYGESNNVNTLYTATPGFVNALDYDFRLNRASVCLDGGNNELAKSCPTDYSGGARIQNGTVDIGPFEGANNCPVNESPLNDVSIRGTEGEAIINFKGKWDENPSYTISRYFLQYWNHPESITTVDISSDLSYSANFNVGQSIYWRIGVETDQGVTNYSEVWCVHVPHVHPIYVKSGMTGDGSSWSSALGDLNEALNQAVTGDQIWVAAGTYKPTTDDDRTISFELKHGVKLYGGFAGNETSLEQRNWYVNQTILSGDIGIKDDVNDNSIHVVVCQLVEGEEAWLDGFILEKGNAVKWKYNQHHGGGLLHDGGNLIINYCWFRINYANQDGGALYCNGHDLKCYASVFSENKAGRYGGAIRINQGTSVLSGVTVVNNSSDYYGGGIYGENTNVDNSIIYSNKAQVSDYNIGNCEVAYSCVEDEITGEGNITDDPVFIDAANGDFRLNYQSPCINAGMNDSIPSGILTDFKGNDRLAGDVVDMGVFEGGVLTPVNLLPAPQKVIKGELFGNEVTFKWSWEPENEVPSVDKYILQYWERNGDTTMVEVLSELTYTTQLPNATKYYWRVGSVTGANLPAYSPVQSFFITHSHPLYVKEGASGNGSSWENAFGGLQEALAEAVYGDEIWVAAGTYKPTTGLDQGISFNMKSGVKLYGGFGGIESSREERAWISNKTILSGDIGEADIETDNSYCVVRCREVIDATTLLDGFVIENGCGDGAGIWIKEGDLCLKNMVFRENHNSVSVGGAIYSDKAIITLINSVFSENTASLGGGVFSEDGKVIITNCVFYNNYASYGGGAVYIRGNYESEIANSVFLNNRAEERDNEVYGASIYYCRLDESDNGEGNITKNPQFVDPENGDFRLQAGSPCIGAGNKDVLPEGLLTDFQGITRVVGANVDMGAYEYMAPAVVFPGNGGGIGASGNHGINFRWGLSDGYKTSTIFDNPYLFDFKLWRKGEADNILESAQVRETSHYTRSFEQGTYQWQVGMHMGNDVIWSEMATFYIGHDHIIYVKDGATGAGTSWSDAFGTLHEALDYALPGDEIWVAAGTYYPVTTQTNGTASQAEREVVLSLKPGVKLLGGFKGDETIAGQSKFAKNLTIISGDIGAKDNESDNSFGLFRNVFSENQPLENGTLVDGFIFEHASGSNEDGGAMYNEYASPAIANCIFRNNRAQNGGAVANKFSHPLFYDVLFVNNQAVNDGGAIHNAEGTKPELINCTISKNKASTTGGILGNCLVVNSIVYGNQGTQVAEGAEVTHSCVAGGYEGEGNVSGDPLFSDAENDDFNLEAFSSCIDQGKQTLIKEMPVFDLAGNGRIMDLDVDMGAYEAQEKGSLEIVSITPENGAVDVDNLQDITIQFNQPVTIPDFCAYNGDYLDPFSFKLSEDKKRLTTSPEPRLSFGKTYIYNFANRYAVYEGNNTIGLKPFTLTFTVRDCIPASFEAVSSQTDICPMNNDTLRVKVTGDLTNDYTWTFHDEVVAEGKNETFYAINQADDSNLGIYTVAVNDQCGNTATQQIEVKFKETTPLEVRQKWDNVLLVDNASGQFSDFNWYFNDAPIETRQYVALNSGKDGEVYVTAVDKASGCMVTSEVKTIQGGALKSMTVSPNPAKVSQTVSIVLPQLVESGTVRMYDLGGHLVVQRDIADQQVVDFTDTNVTPGVYIVEVQTGLGVEKRKLVIEN
ncbi:T9SS C-terminal target domain-containing protein [Marinilabiliaceae bacterium JC017]|nr:T9SS C-terminal target domain-containing protein [Marinilabiliaceae bacterium JC017]